MIEILVVIVIIGIMAGIFGVSGYQPALERQRGMEGISNLELIHNAEKRFFLENNRYFLCAACTPQDIMHGLGFMIDINYFDYSIINNSTVTQPGYIANAIRKSGECQGKNLTIRNNNSTIEKGCSQW